MNNSLLCVSFMSAGASQVVLTVTNACSRGIQYYSIMRCSVSNQGGKSLSKINLHHLTKKKKGRWTELCSVGSTHFGNWSCCFNSWRATTGVFIKKKKHSNNWRTIAMWLFVDLALFIISMPEDPRGVWHEGSSLQPGKRWISELLNVHYAVMQISLGD